jgi:hypothetical protein
MRCFGAPPVAQTGSHNRRLFSEKKLFSAGIDGASGFGPKPIPCDDGTDAGKHEVPQDEKAEIVKEECSYIDGGIDAERLSFIVDFIAAYTDNTT